MPDSACAPVPRCAAAHWPGSVRPDARNGRRAAREATALRLPAALWSATGVTALKPGITFFSLDAPNGVADLAHPLIQAQTRCVQGRAPIIGQGGAYGQTIPPDRVVFRRGVLFQGAFNAADAAQFLLALGFSVPIGFVKRFRGIFEVVKLAQLMGDAGKDEGHRAANRLLAIRS